MLTDNELTIIALLRIVPEGPDQEELRVGLKYSLENRQNYKGVPALTKERVRHALQNAVQKGGDDIPATKKKSKKKPGDVLRKALTTSLNEFPPMLLDHALRIKGFEADVQLEDILNNEGRLDQLMLVLEEAQDVVSQITKAPVSKGFIVAKIRQQAPVTEASDGSTVAEKFVYEDFHPFRPAQFEGAADIRILESEPFNKTVDEFFSSIEAQKLESRLTEREEHAKKKLDSARQDHEKRLGGLQQVQELNVRKAEAIESNLQKVQEAVAAVNGLIAQGMDWVEIARLIEMEQARHNPVAETIKLPLKLYENTVTLMLFEIDYEDEVDFEGNETGSDASESDGDQGPNKGPTKTPKAVDKRLAVDVDLALSPWSNARQYYEQKRSAAVKEQKTLQSSAKALKSTEKKINADLKKGLKQEKQVMRPVRNQRWFEKFLYFISSEGYLVLGGRDAQQNEMLYKRYLRKGDIYVHADLQGAASIIIKNKPGMLDSPIPPSTLSQAGTLAVATSSAWDSKAVMSAWWVKPDQVSRTAPTGEYLTTGAFTIRGLKNFLPPAQLLLGFGVMFQVSEESKARHLKHRIVEETVETSQPVVKDTGRDADGDHVATTDDDGTEARSEHSQEQQPGSEQDGDGETGDENGDKLDPTGGDTLKEEENIHADEEPEVDSNDEDEEEENEITSKDAPNPLQPHPNPAEEQDGTSTDSEDDALSGKEEANGEPTSTEAHKLEDHVEAHSGEENDLPPSTNATGAVSGVRHLSARERRLLRQNREPTNDQGDQQQKVASNAASEQGDTSSQPTPPTTSTEKPTTKPQAPQVRGKHGKRNKLKTKYADQDEEDRALALRVLGSAAGQQKATEDAASKKAKDEELTAQKERRRKQHALAVEKGKASEEIRRLNLGEGIETLDDTEAEGLNDLDAYVGTPLPGDEILDALVVCGPWDAIGGRCRWRAKLQPGAMKKGKAVREILGAWTVGIAEREKKKKPPPREGEDEGLVAEEKVRSRETALIKGIRETEVIGVLPVGKCRVIMGGGEKSGNATRGGGGAGKGKRGGKGSKKQR